MVRPDECVERRAHVRKRALRTLLVLARADLYVARERIARYEEALRYIERPTVGHPGGLGADDHDAFVLEPYPDGATEPNARLALATCIRMARAALAEPDP